MLKAINGLELLMGYPNCRIINIPDFAIKQSEVNPINHEYILECFTKI
jgi:hypothetical protein